MEKRLTTQISGSQEWNTLKVNLKTILSGKWRYYYCLKVAMFCNFKQAERGRIEDNRVDVCLYLLPPTGHGVKKIDMESLKRIQAWNINFLASTKLNLFAGICDCNTLCCKGWQFYKRGVNGTETESIIQVFISVFFNIIYCSKIKQQLKQNKVANHSLSPHLGSMMPLSLIGSNTSMETKYGQRLRVRKYPWGTVNTEDEVNRVLCI